MSPLVTEALLDVLAAELRVAAATRVPVAPLIERHPQLTVADAYAIQGRNATGRPVRGHKIGLTSLAMQEMLGVHEPDYGRVFADELLTSGDSVASDQLIAPKVEPEIAFVLKDELPSDGVTVEHVIAATDYVLPALEIIDSRIADWRIGLVDTVADNASCGRVVLGEGRTPITAVDLPAVRAELRVGGDLVQEGVGAAVLGHPAEAVAWLANAVGQFGVRLAPGDVVMSGSFCAAAPLVAGDHVIADFGVLGTVEVRCA